MEKNFTIIKFPINNIFSTQAQTSKPPDATDIKTYANLLYYFHLSNLVPSNPLCPNINKNQEIVSHFNNLEQNVIFKDMSMDIILKDLNICTNKMGGYCALRAIKRLFGWDFAVLTIHNKETKKLQNNS